MVPSLSIGRPCVPPDAARVRSNITIGIRVVHVDHPPTLTLQGALPLQLVEDAPFTFNGTLGHVDSNAGLTFNASISGGPYLSGSFVCAPAPRAPAR